MITCLIGADHVTDHVLIPWLSCTEDVTQQAIIMDFSCDESCGTAGNNQAAEKAGITRLSWQFSSR
ncbi:hypothetical protein ANAPC3_01375 [Anaplasma phagocytophilum]|nr:hypothetical protein ANAPC3_01375 [Anaplasma phagocytophilum]